MQPPTPAASTKQPVNNDAEQRRRAVEVASYVKKLLDAYRLLDANHPTLPEIESTAWDKASKYLDQFGELSFELSPISISIEGKVVVEAKRKTDSLSFPLFAEGIHEILFGRSLDARQLHGFIKIWAKACVDINSDEVKKDEVSVTTKIWEADFEAIELVAMQTVQEGSESEGDGDHDRRLEIQQAMQAVSGTSDGSEGGIGRRLIGGTGGDAGALDFWSRAAETKGVLFKERLALDDESALELLGAELNLPLSSKSIFSLPPSPSSRLSTARIHSMREELQTTWSTTHVDHYITSVFMLAIDATEEEVDALMPALRRVIAKQCEEKSFPQLSAALHYAKAESLNSSSNRNACYPIIERLLLAINSPRILDMSVDAIDRSDLRDHALHLLSLLHPVHTHELIQRLDRLNTPPGIKALLQLIASKNPKAQDLAQVASQSKPTVAQAVLRMASTINAEDAQLIRRTVLCHPDALIRKNILDGIRPEDVPTNIAEIRTLILDPEIQIREMAMLLAVQVKDEGAIAALASIVSGDFSHEEKKKAVMGIARIGATAAGLSLRKAFLQQKNIELRCVCALALGEMGDQSARSLLEKEAQRVLGRGQLKASCKEALRRLDAHQNATKPAGARG
jgi:hypothetical protein